MGRDRQVEDEISERQTPEFVEKFEAMEFRVLADLDVFDNGKWYISLEFPQELCITPAWSLEDSYWKDVPVHITLGKPP